MYLSKKYLDRLQEKGEAVSLQISFVPFSFPSDFSNFFLIF